MKKSFRIFFQHPTKTLDFFASMMYNKIENNQKEVQHAKNWMRRRLGPSEKCPCPPGAEDSAGRGAQPNQSLGEQYRVSGVAGCLATAL
jgi:hypothetical protein